VSGYRSLGRAHNITLMLAPHFALPHVRRFVAWRAVATLICVVLGAGALAACESSSAAVRTGQTECVSPRDLPVGQTTQTITTGGVERSYLLYVPEQYDPTHRTPVAVMFHGLGGDPKTVLESTEMVKQADQRGAILVLPLGRGKPARWQFREPVSDPTSDLAFVRALVKHIKRTGCVDSQRVYAAGFSNGSALTLALACDGSTQFAAYAAVAGPYFASQCADAPPASIVYFHGTKDSTVPFEGAETVIGPLPAVNDIMANWALHDRCPADDAVTTATDSVLYYGWSNCRGGTAVDIYAVVGGVHGWPGGGPMSPGRTSKTKDSPIDATSVMWKFFDQNSPA
jgi:polyhydroxybutyrate depolymerase